MIDHGEHELLVRTVADALHEGADSDADTMLAQLGWVDLLADHRQAAISVVFDQLGRTNSSSRCLSDVVVSALGGRPATGLWAVLPRYGAADRPSALDGGGAVVDGLAIAARAALMPASLLVACGDDRAVELPTDRLRLEPVVGVDPTLRLLRVSGRAEPTAIVESADWSSAVDLARLALAHELVGAAHTMLTLARDHALGRAQFDRPIASFQAVRHRLAEVLVAVEGAEAALRAAWETPNTTTAALAKVLAGRAATSAGTHCQQVLAGIGFTREHDFHRYLLRTIALEGLFGSGAALTRHLGGQLLRDRSVPRVIEL